MHLRIVAKHQSPRHKKQKAPPKRWGLHFPAQNQEGIAGKTATEITGMRVNETLMRGPKGRAFRLNAM